jgi:PhnB protein
MLTVNPYLNFDGDCKTAFEFYARLLGGKLEVQTFGESPMGADVGPEMKNRVLHARLELPNSVLMASDAQVGQYQKPKSFAVSIQVDNATDADRIFAALAENGSVDMPIQETFWAERFGMCRDRFGIPWMVNCSKVMAGAGA